MAYATSSDVGSRLGRTLTADEVAQVNALLADVEGMIKDRIPDLGDKVVATPSLVATLVRVEANAVKRVMINPTGIRSHSEALGPESHSDTYDSAVATGELYVSDAEWGALLPSILTRRRGSIRLVAYGEL